MNEKVKPSLLLEVASYYSNKLAKYGSSPQGVDWNSKEGQTLRFEQLCKIIQDNGESFSLNDLGCGYGALLDFLSDRYSAFSYIGFDVSEDMVIAAESRCKIGTSARFVAKAEPDNIADYSVASGVFNVRLEHSDSDWFDYLLDTMDVLNRTSRRGFAFNCLTSYSDDDKKRDYLYYADPCQLFDLCKRRYAKQVALLHDYGLYEFTILVRKTP